MSKKILIVDDEPDLIKVTSPRLAKLGYKVLIAVSGTEAIDLIRLEPPDLILLDLRLPGIDGAEVCRRLKADPALRHIPVILFTASAESVEEIFKGSGADDWLLKPFDSSDLIAKVRKFIPEGS
jgi:CheY-like chemotaxis protein